MRRATWCFVVLTATIAAADETQLRMPTVLVGEGKAATRYEPPRIVAFLSIFAGGLRTNPEDFERPLVFVFDDGRVLWSEDPVKGGAPFRVGQVPPSVLKALAGRVEGYDAAGRAALTTVSVGPDATHAVLYVRTDGDQHVLMKSWHPRDPKAQFVATSRGLVSREGRDPAAVLAADTAEYRRFRQVWAELEGELTRLTASAGSPKPVRATFTWAWVDWP